MAKVPALGDPPYTARMADDPRDTEVAALRGQVAELTELVTRLGKELLRAHQRVDLTMRGQLRCRGCGARRIAHAFSVLDRGDGDQRKEMALYQGSWWRSQTTGKLEAYACTRCGLVEWYVKDPGTLVEHEDYLRILDGGPEEGEGPYR